MDEPRNAMLLSRRAALIGTATAGMALALAEEAGAFDSIKTAAHTGPGCCSPRLRSCGR